MTGATVELTGVSKTFVSGRTRLTAVNDVTLRFAAGSMTAITGASGAGKSTLLHLIGAIETADEGSIRVDDLELTRLRRKRLTAYRRGVGFIFQRYHLLPTLTALDNVIMPVLPYRVRFNKTARARDLLATVGLASRERALPAELSGGQQQRVAIARALIASPRLLLADEPTGNLDSVNGAGVLNLLGFLCGRLGMTVIVATHEHHVAARTDRMVRLRDGRVVDDVDLTEGESSENTLRRATGLQG
jgi:putative ABC transport system ATP-binding protein